MTTRVAILYRVKQHWRVPIFERLALNKDFDIKVFHSSGFTGTKVINSHAAHEFESKEMFSIPIRLKTSNGDALMPFSPFLFFELVRFKPDIILCEGASNLLNNIPAYLYAKIFRAKTIQWGLGEIQNRKKSGVRRLLDKIIKSMEKRSSACLAYSDYGKRYYQSVGVEKDKIFVAVNVIDTDKAKQVIAQLDKDKIYAESHRDTEVNLLFVGALTKPKCVDLLIRAFSVLQSKTGKRLSLTIIGDGPEMGSLKSIANELGLEQVEFCGKVVDGVSKYFLASDIFVLPGLGGLAVSEALVHGVPVVSGIGDGCEKDLLASGGGIFDEKLDLDSLINHLYQVIEHPLELQRLKTEAIAVIENKHNINTYITSVFECLEYVAKRS